MSDVEPNPDIEPDEIPPGDAADDDDAVDVSDDE